MQSCHEIAALEYAITQTMIRNNADARLPRLGSKICDHPSYDTRRRRRLTLKARLLNIQSPKLRYEITKTLDPQDTALDHCII